MKLDNSKNQLRWVILLLAIAVILPTVCLLWFMVHAAENETLALRQKMVNNYEARLKELTEVKLGDREVGLSTTLVFCDGFCVYDSNGNLTFPVDDKYDLSDSEGILKQAYKYEYNDNELQKAIDEYSQISKTSDSNDLTIKADISVMRCLKKLDNTDEAIKQAEAIIKKYNDSSRYIRSQKCHAHMLLMELYPKAQSKDYAEVLSSAFDYITQGLDSDKELPFLGRKSHADLYVPTSLQMLALDRFINYAGNIEKDQPLNRKFKMANRLIKQIENAISLAEQYPTPDFIKGTVINSRIFRLKSNERFYGNYSIIRGYTSLKILTVGHIKAIFDRVITEIEDEMVFCRAYDEKGDFITGTKPTYAGREVKFGQKFSSYKIEGYLSGCTIDMYFYSGTFSNAAKRRQVTYIIAAALILMMIIPASMLATRAVLRQAKVNTLKNDFIATVTHELKTPLASMRVLVDTLLEGNYNDQTQATEYLQLISKENKRLTGLIDNFLTFSRMERNKQSFEIVPTSPTEIAKDAVHAIKTKFAQGNCHFTTNIPENLPKIRADRDAIVTVLINLLGNAYKYSADNKQIELTLFEHESQVFFKVKDNGNGMPPRVTRRIFDRFYQADSRLSRSAEGCGLGLSIVKFIVDAHKGTIKVQSKLNKGSEFTVIIPTA